MNGTITSTKTSVELGMMRTRRASSRRIGSGLLHTAMERHTNLGVLYHHSSMEMTWGDSLIQVHREAGGGAGGEDGWLLSE